MRTLNATFDDAIYDEATDVMFFRIGESRFTDEEEISPGVHVLYAYETERKDEIVGIEIEGFKRKFGDRPSMITLSEPASLSLCLA